MKFLNLSLLPTLHLVMAPRELPVTQLQTKTKTAPTNLLLGPPQLPSLAKKPFL